MISAALRAFGIWFLCVASWAQTGSGPLAFDVASVKPSAPDDRGYSIETTAGGGLNVANASAQLLILFAWDIRDFQLSGGPGWLGTDRYNITARIGSGHASAGASESSMTDAQRNANAVLVRERLRTLLAERFGLVVHHESKEVTGYVLTVAKGGPKMKTTIPENEAHQGMRGTGRGHTQGYARTTEQLANYLAGVTGRPVTDKTGLTEKYDWTLDWTQDAPATPESTNTAETGPTLFTAIQEQLGLKLEAMKQSVDSIVIDRIVHPTEN